VNLHVRLANSPNERLALLFRASCRIVLEDMGILPVRTPS